MSADNWDAYWRNAQSAAAHKDGGPQDEALERFWMRFFEEVFSTIKSGSGLLDIACGNGAVPRFALAASQSLDENINLQICGIDESPAALLEMKKRESSLVGVAASALQLPFDNGVFDLITSQFGMEYAGSDVFTEVSRVVCPGGVIAAVLHMKDGGIYKECKMNLEAIDSLRRSDILANFDALFRGILKIKEGKGDKETIQSLDRKFAASVASVEDVLKRWGKGVASETLFRIYTDIGHMYKRLNAYDAAELFNWIEVMKNELASYSGRMSSMLAAALDETEFEKAMTTLHSLGLEIRIRDSLSFGRQTSPSAWVFVAEKIK
jgi:ubiquinone/menaquinone biosynthesis C-methylase UbiE